MGSLPQQQQLRDRAAALQAEIRSLENRLKALQDRRQQTKVSTAPAIPRVCELPDLPPDQAMLFGEINGMLSAAPTEALAELLARMRGTSVDDVVAAARRSAGARAALPPSRQVAP